MSTIKREPLRSPWLRAVMGLVFPPVLALLVFAVAIGAVIVPVAEEALMERKRETLQAIVGSALSLLARHEAEVAAGRVEAGQARQDAREELRALRYGSAGKDYLWIMDRDLRMVMHPYKNDLEGHSVAAFEDKAGKRVFVECLALIEKSGEGNVEYLWQWQDDPGRIEPKLSYIREFKPWGWIVGTGLYLDDVRTGLRQLALHLYGAAALAGAVMFALLATGMRQGWRAEQLRRTAERELAASHERYRALAHASDDLAILFLAGRAVGANRSACEGLGLAEQALIGRPVEDILRAERDAPLVQAIRSGVAVAEHETVLAGAGGGLPVLLSGSVVHVGGESAVMLAGRRLQPQREEEQADELERAGVGRLRLVADRVFTMRDASPAAARLLAPSAAALSLRDVLPDADHALLRHEFDRHGVIPGMLLRTRDGHRLRLWAARSSSAPAGSTFPALVAGAAGEADRMGPPVAGLGPFPLLPAAGSAGVPITLEPMQAWAGSAIRSGVHPELVTGPLGHLLDRLIRQSCEQALADAGEPPASVCLLAVGSIGRGEPTLNPDQDTALMLADGVDYGDWPARFGEAVTRRLEAAGLPPCKAGHTAANPEWRLTGQAWVDLFARWIRASEPRDLMEVNIFFDFRPVWGDEAMAAGLRRRIFACVHDRPVFLHHLAADTMEFRLPLDVLGRIRPDHPGEDHIDLKGAMLHIVNFARIYSLRHQIPEIATALRLGALGRARHLPPDTVQDTLDAWRHLLALRLRLQQERIERNLAPESIAVLSALSHWDREVLKLALSRIGHLQQRLAAEILRTV